MNENIEAFEVLYAKYKDRIKYFIFNIIKDYEKAEDIMQDVFVYVMKNNHYGDPADNLLSMLNPGITGRQESMSKTNNISDLPPEILEQFKDLLTD